MDLIIVILLILLLIIFISPAKIKFEGEDLIFSVPLLFIEKRKKKNELETYRVEFSAFPIMLQFKDGTVYRWTSFPQWHSQETLNNGSLNALEIVSHGVSTMQKVLPCLKTALLILVLSSCCLGTSVFAWSRLPFYEGYVRLKVLTSSPEMIFCTFEVSGGAPSELLAIDIKHEPKILWKIVSDGKNGDIFTGSYAWDVIWIDQEIVYTLSGSILQKRQRIDGVILKELNVSALVTPASNARPWDEMEERLAALRQDLGKNQDEIDLLVERIKDRKREWQMLENYTQARSGGPNTESDRVHFLGVTKNSICIHRTRYHHIPGGARKVFEEEIFLTPEELNILPFEKVEWEENQQIPNSRPPYPSQLNVLGNIELETMDVEEKKDIVTLVGSNPDKNETLWKLEIPVVLKRVPHP